LKKEWWFISHCDEVVSIGIFAEKKQQHTTTINHQTTTGDA